MGLYQEKSTGRIFETFPFYQTPKRQKIMTYRSHRIDALAPPSRVDIDRLSPETDPTKFGPRWDPIKKAAKKLEKGEITEKQFRTTFERTMDEKVFPKTRYKKLADRGIVEDLAIRGDQSLYEPEERVDIYERLYGSSLAGTPWSRGPLYRRSLPKMGIGLASGQSRFTSRYRIPVRKWEEI
jgi:hypothetical protein